MRRPTHRLPVGREAIERGKAVTSRAMDVDYLQDAGKRRVSLGEITTETLAELQSRRPEQCKMLRIFAQLHITGAG
jgi:hypothetical protein